MPCQRTPTQLPLEDSAVPAGPTPRSEPPARTESAADGPGAPPPSGSDEVWKPVPGLVEVYASSHGRISRCRRRLSGLGKRSVHPGALNKQGGYLRMMIYRRMYLAHRLVALAFHPNPDGLPEINHKNSIPCDNRPENLEWCDRTHNMRHAAAKGRMGKVAGVRCGFAKFTEAKVREVYAAVTVHGMSCVEAGRRFGMSTSAVWAIATSNSWRHLNLRP